jgi:hypothetical protein
MLYIVVPNAVFEPWAVFLTSDNTLITFLAMNSIGNLLGFAIITLP